MSSRQADAVASAGGPSWSRSIVRSWIVACSAAEVVGMGSGALLVRAASPDGEPSSALVAIGAGAATGLVEGATLGALQWRVLRKRFSSLRAAGWIGITVTAAIVGWTLGSLPSAAPSQNGAEPSVLLTLVLAAALGAAMGVLFGAAQWFVLRRHAHRPGRWVVANAAGWTAAMPVVFLGATSPTTETATALVGVIGALTGAVAGAVLGAITAWWLVRVRPLQRVRKKSLVNTVVAAIPSSPLHWLQAR